RSRALRPESRACARPAAAVSPYRLTTEPSPWPAPPIRSWRRARRRRRNRSSGTEEPWLSSFAFRSDGGHARLMPACRRVVVASDAFSLRNDRNVAARFEDGEFDLVHPLEPIIAPRRFEYFLLGEACAPQSRAQDVAVLDDDGGNAFENPSDARHVALEERKRNIHDDECRDDQEGMGERIILRRQRALRQPADHQEQDEVEHRQLAERA